LAELLPQDIIEGAEVQDCANLFVIGCYDRRITFYSQQVRALSLVDALKRLGYLNANPRIAIVGGGAAGTTAAAALALVSASNIVVFEAAADLMSLQSTTERRRLDPRIYDWPRSYTLDPIADLPILDWESGTSRSVRRDVQLGFEDIAARVEAGRLTRRLRHRVTEMNTTADGYELAFTDLNLPAERAGETQRERFNMVFLVVGFGAEPTEPIPGIQTASYWSDAGVPAGEIEARSTARFSSAATVMAH
jgi:hypothetical protein